MSLLPVLGKHADRARKRRTETEADRLLGGTSTGFQPSNCLATHLSIKKPERVIIWFHVSKDAAR
jgi:hypothetical protein